MCGIAGIIDFRKNSNISDELLKKMSDVIIHRGPDSDGLYLSEDRKCGFSFRRLAIVDLSDAGNQPMTTNDGRYTIVFNGEIYNHRDIRKELVELGYRYKSNTDTETILYGYIEWKEKILDKLVGMWAISIWDNEKKELFAARDRIGIKPYYYYNEKGLFVFGSEIKSILQHKEIPSNLNINQLPIYLNFGTTANYASLFQNINKLESGHYLILNESGISVREYWNPLANSLKPENRSSIEIQNEILLLLRQAVKDRMMSDVPFGVFLSGGIDSSLNVALMAELMNRPVDTFTVGFKELEKFNELKYARRVSELFKTNHKEILIDHNDAFGELDNIAFHTDEPNADPVCIPLFFLSKLTREAGTTVIQVGEGSDEQFTGYKWMLRDYNFNKKFYQNYKMLPNFVRKSILTFTKPFFNIMGQHLALEYLRRGSNGEELSWSGVPILSTSHQEYLIETKFKNLIELPSQYADKIFSNMHKQSKQIDYLQSVLYVELKQRLAELLLMRVDKMTMAHSLEARVPFLDHRLIEFTMSLSEQQRIPQTSEPKYLLKKAVENILPKDIIYRQKMGFAAPVENWFRECWYQYSYDEIINSEFIKNGIFNKTYIEKMFLSHKSGKANRANEMYSLLMLVLWQKRFKVQLGI